MGYARGVLLPSMAKKLKTRIVCVYRALEPDAESDYGALAWFARKARVYPYTVTRWLTGQRPFAGPAAALLEELETQASALSTK
jgi:hypothetical protein